ncbi:hypothetical protein NQ317_018011 [Molorchus minor]|uniref:Uncharacterized protein n=1 Tax=Molorchus minor TaxID=1323400 RepID=A0ABQ9JTY2_9CUCU|nr:hypothetical protein NQ317_018011 [Molorchus minor]
MAETSNLKMRRAEKKGGIYDEQVAIRKIWDSKVVKLVWTYGYRALILRRNKVIENAWLTWSFQRASVCIVGDFPLKIPFCWSRFFCMDWNSIKKPPAQVFVHVTGTTFCERVRCTKFGTVICPVDPFGFLVVDLWMDVAGLLDLQVEQVVRRLDTRSQEQPDRSTDKLSS